MTSIWISCGNISLSVFGRSMIATRYINPELTGFRYYYAIAEFSTVEAARHVMDECNGTEYERTANVMDLSYVPDDMEFANDEIKWVFLSLDVV